MRDLIGTVLAARPRAQAPVPYSSRRASGLFSLGRSMGGDREQQAAAYGANGTLFAIVAGIAVDVSMCDWKLWRKAASGKPEDRTEITSHAALDVWDRPNPFMPGQEYREVVQQHLELTGEGWQLYARAGLAPWPIELWPVFPHRMEPVPDPIKFLAGYVYQSPDGEKVPLETRDVGLLRQPHPLDMMRGLGVVAAISTNLDSAKYAGMWNRNFFLNSAEPGGIIEVERRLSDDEFDEMVSRWREQHQGVANAHRVAVLEQGKWVDRKYTQRDMQFVELLGVSREAIREAYRYPVAMLGESKDVNRAVAQAQKAIYAEAIVVPRLERWKGWLNHEFLPQFGTTTGDLEFDYVSPVPSDREGDDAERLSKAQSAKLYTDAGWDGPIVAEALDLPEQLRSGWSKPEPPAPPLGGPPAGQNGNGKGKAGNAWADAVQSLTAGRPVDAAGQVDLDPVQADWQRQLDTLMADWEREVTPAQRDELADQVRAAINAGDLAALGALTAGAAAGAGLLAAAMAELAATAAGQVVAEAAAQGVTVEAATVGEAAFTAAAWVTARLLAQGYATAAGREALRWVGYNHDGDAVANGVRTYLKGLGDSGLRAQLGGSLTWAQNTGRIETLRGADGKVSYYASETLDGRTCSACSKIDGKRLPTLDAVILAYGGGGYLWCLGRERCRGSVVATWDVTGD